MRVAYVGNFEPDHSTENEVRKAFGIAGHQVTPYQENATHTFLSLGANVTAFDMVLWTRTGWTPAPEHQDAMLALAREAGVPTVGFHLDRWFGLHREGQVTSEPFFRCDTVFTADGGHQDEFAAAGVNHHWLPPAMSELECVPGTFDPGMASDVAFVGSWQPGYHAEWTHRPELVRWLKRRGCGFWPKPGHHAVRGERLRDLYASTKVNVGDSCLAGGATRYWSDRIPETLGRGGFLLHPYVEGIEDHFTDGTHLRLWNHGDFDELGRLIDYYLEHDDERRAIAEAGQAHVLEHHTYTVRARQIVEHVTVPV